MIKAILFDLGNVLVQFDLARGYQAVEPYSRYRAPEMPRLIAASGLVHPYERGEISSQEFFGRICGVLGLEVSYHEFCRLWSAIFLPEPLVPEDLLAGLRRRYRMVLVSNTNDIHFRMIQQNYPLLRHFDAHVLSYQVGAMKPSERMYEEAVRQARCEPGDCFYTDDVPDFVEGGRKHGLDAVQFRGAADLEQELTRRGLL